MSINGKAIASIDQIDGDLRAIIMEMTIGLMQRIETHPSLSLEL